MELEKLRADMVAAMKAKDKPRKEAISSLISAAKKVAIDEGCRDDISPALVDRVILKELKTVKEQIDTCPDSREDLKAEYQFRYDVISEYAPKQMTAEEVKAYIQEKFADAVATKNKGMIMKSVMADMKGKADGKLINQIVAELCK
ncbi:MAG: GatB/YqeY domain-containing protein [Lachnospiraceae bacterium]|nr:GatB/YqeY domain-containing protein [Lachnospiraceae bacterium]